MNQRAALPHMPTDTSDLKEPKDGALRPFLRVIRDNPGIGFTRLREEFDGVEESILLWNLSRLVWEGWAKRRQGRRGRYWPRRD